MTNTKQHPFSYLLEDLFNPLGGASYLAEKGNNYPTAAVNIYETPEAYHLALNAPGRKREDFSIQVENGLLQLSYQAPEKPTTPEYKVVRKEFTYRSFKRSFSLDEKINTAGIQAKYEEGVLKVLLPKKEVQQLQKQEISIL